MNQCPSSFPVDLHRLPHGSALLAGLALILAALPTPAAGAEIESGPSGESPKPLKIITLSEPAFVERRSFPGYLKAPHDAVLSFRVSGPLVELPAVKGTVVKKGDLLARIDPRDYVSALSSLDAEVQRAREQLLSLERARPEDITSAEAAVSAAKATADHDKAELERNRNLHQQGVIPTSTLDRLQAQADVSAGALEQALQTLQKAEAGARSEDVKAAEAGLQSLEAKRKAAADSLADTELLAPFDGVLSERYAENHQMVAAGAAVLSLQDLETFEVVINIPEQLLIRSPRNSILARTTATARFDVIPDTAFPLTFKEYSTRVGIQAQTFAATFLMSPPHADYTFLPGMTVTVDVKFVKREPDENETFAFPPEAILSENNGQSYAWRLSRTARENVHKAEKVMVTVGELVEEGLIVTSGVKAGEKYAGAGAAYLREGMLVSELGWEGK